MCRYMCMCTCQCYSFTTIVFMFICPLYFYIEQIYNKGMEGINIILNCQCDILLIYYKRYGITRSSGGQLPLNYFLGGVLFV